LKELYADKAFAEQGTPALRLWIDTNADTDDPQVVERFF
jgi:hypothetical protein